MMKKIYKEAGNGWYCSVDENGNKSSSWTEKNRPGYFEEMKAWEAEGNEIEPQFTAEELAVIDAEAAEYEKVKYIDQRKAEYPPIGDQLDYIYWNGIEAWKTDIITPVKEKYPKPK